MPFVIADPQFVTAAASQLAGIGSSLETAAEAAAFPTTGIVAAASDEISVAVSRLFGNYGQEFQAINLRAEAFHAEFVRMLNGGAAAYAAAEAGAQQALLGAAAAPAAADPLGGLLGGLLGGGTGTGGNGLLSGILGGSGGSLTLPTIPGFPALSLVLPPNLLSPPSLSTVLGGATGLVGQLGNSLTGLQNLLLPPAATMTTIGPYPNPYLTLIQNTSNNLSLMGVDYRPFPVLAQVVTNQAHYAQFAANAFAYNLSGFPGNVPANVALNLQLLSTGNLAAGVNQFVNGTTGFWGTVGTQLSRVGAGLQTTFPAFQHDLQLASMAWNQGDYNGAVQYSSHSLIDLFITGFNTSNLTLSSVTVSLGPLSGLGFPVDVAVAIVGPIGVLGPAGELLPILTAIGQQVQGTASTFPLGSIPSGMVHNLANGINAITNAGVSADFSAGVKIPLLGLPQLAVDGEALFGLPLQLGFSLLGSPFAALNGLATGAAGFQSSLAAGNILGALNAVGNTPAFVLDGVLNGEVVIQQPLPVNMTVAGLPVNLPVIANLPLTGLLVHPHGITATVPLSQLLPVPGLSGLLPDITIPLGGSKFGGLVPFLINTMPQQIADAMDYANS